MATDLVPMEAKLVADLPDEVGWQFEPKWDGFRALIFRRGDEIEIMSKSGKPLSRYFPEVVQVIREVDCRAFVLDGELILPVGDVLSFDALQARLHPAASRIERLSRETPAQIMLFDCLSIDGQELLERPMAISRKGTRSGVPASSINPDRHATHQSSCVEALTWEW